MKAGMCKGCNSSIGMMLASPMKSCFLRSSHLHDCLSSSCGFSHDDDFPVWDGWGQAFEPRSNVKRYYFWISKETQRNTKMTHTRFQPFCYKTKKQTRVDMRCTRAQNRVPRFFWKHNSILLHLGSLLVWLGNTKKTRLRFHPAGYDKKETDERSYVSFVTIPSRLYVFASKMGNRNAFPLFSIQAMEKHSNVSRKPDFLSANVRLCILCAYIIIDSKHLASHQAKRNTASAHWHDDVLESWLDNCKAILSSDVEKLSSQCSQASSTGPPLSTAESSYNPACLRVLGHLPLFSRCFDLFRHFEPKNGRSYHS